MKTQKKNHQNEKRQKVAVSKVISIVILSFFFLSRSYSQNDFIHTKVGFRADTYISGNLLGVLYSPCITVSKARGMVFGGPVIQQRTSRTGGFKFGYSFNITGGNEKSLDCNGEVVDGIFSLNAFGYVQYTNGFSLSYRNQVIEEMGSSIKDYNWNNYKASTAEFCGGVALNVKLSKYLTWRNYAGFSYSEQKNYMQGMWNDKSNFGLLIGTGICFQTSR
jgi:hypothetical protein